jgi:WD40 repeat protein
MYECSWNNTTTSFWTNGDVIASNGEETFISASLDGTLRVWNIPSGLQTYEFDVLKDPVTVLAIHPVQTKLVAVGFQSGCVRIFNIQGTSPNRHLGRGKAVVHEFQQHQSAICHLQYCMDGRFLFTSGSGQQICKYDATEQYTPLKMMIVEFDGQDGKFSLSQDMKWLTIISHDHKRALILDPKSLRPFSFITPQASKEEGNTRRSTAESMIQLNQLMVSWNSKELILLSKSNRIYIFLANPNIALFNVVTWTK